MLGIFISYRRADSASATGRLADALEAAFGHELVFRDIDRISPGVAFQGEIEKSIEGAGVALVVIGSKWLGAVDDNGECRLDKVNDPVRVEIRTALARPSVKTIPVLVDGAQAPAAESLPEDVRALAGLQGFVLSDSRWRYDVARLIEEIERVPGLIPLAAPRLVSRLEAQREGPAQLVNGLSVMAGALIVAGSIAMTIAEGPRLFGLPAFGFTFFALGGLFAVFFLYLIVAGLFHIQARWYEQLMGLLIIGSGTLLALDRERICPILIAAAALLYIRPVCRRLANFVTTPDFVMRIARSTPMSLLWIAASLLVLAIGTTAGFEILSYDSVAYREAIGLVWWLWWASFIVAGIIGVVRTLEHPLFTWRSATIALGLAATAAALFFGMCLELAGGIVVVTVMRLRRGYHAANRPQERFDGSDQDGPL